MLLHWFFVHTGTYNESGPYYGFFSGFGSDIGEVTLLAAVVAGARHVNCHSKGCWRPGHKVDGQPYRVCHRHLPHHRGDKRNVPQSQIEDALR